MVDLLSYFSFRPVLHDWCNKGHGMCYPVCGMVHIKEPLLLIGKSSPCSGSGFPLLLSEWSFTIFSQPFPFLMCCFSITDDVDPVRRCLTASFFANTAKLHYTGVYKTVRDNHVLHIHPTSVLYAERPPQWYVVFFSLSSIFKYHFTGV